VGTPKARVDKSGPVAHRRGPQTHSCWSADSSFPPKPPPPTGGCRAQYDRPQSAYLPAPGTGHPTLVGLSRVTPPENRGGLSSNPGQKYTFKGTFRVREGLLSPLSQIVRRGTGWGSTPSIFLAGLAALPWRPLAHDVPPRSYPRLGVGVYTVPPHLGRPATWCQCPRARGHHTCNFFPY